MSRGIRQVAAVTGTIAPVVLAVLCFYLPKLDTPEARNGGALRLLVWEYQNFIILVLALLSTLGTIFSYWPGSRNKAIKRFLNYLHLRSWGKDSGRDPDYRVSLYVPHRWWQLWHEGELRCFWRTDQNTSKMKWSKNSKPGHDGDGVVGYVWKYEVLVNVSAPSDNCSQEEFNGYLKKTFISEHTHQGLTWKKAAIVGIPVYSDAAELIGVLLVECRLPGKKIDLGDRFSEDASVCALIWEGRL